MNIRIVSNEEYNDSGFIWPRKNLPLPGEMWLARPGYGSSTVAWRIDDSQYAAIHRLDEIPFLYIMWFAVFVKADSRIWAKVQSRLGEGYVPVPHIMSCYYDSKEAP